MSNRLSQWVAAAAELVWPRYCMVCDAKVNEATPPGAICGECRHAVLAEPGLSCPRCTTTVGPHTDLTRGCPRCRGQTFRFTGAVRLGAYDGRLRDAVLRMKSAAGEPLAETLGELWAEDRRADLQTGSPNVVVPVPLHWHRRWVRGYNQAEAIARGVAAGLGLPCRPHALVRTRPTPRQPSQTPTERRENVRGAFRPGRVGGMMGLTVLLVDDVMTTGATADAAAEALRAAGAAQVRVAVLAHR